MTQLILQLKEIVPEYNPSTHALRHALIRKESATREKSAGAAAAGKHRLSSVSALPTLLERSRSNSDPAPYGPEEYGGGGTSPFSYAPLREVRFVLSLYYHS